MHQIQFRLGSGGAYSAPQTLHLRGPTTKGGGRKGMGEEKGRDPQGLVDTPQVPNPEKYPAEDRFGGLAEPSLSTRLERVS